MTYETATSTFIAALDNIESLTQGSIKAAKARTVSAKLIGGDTWTSLGDFEKNALRAYIDHRAPFSEIARAAAVPLIAAAFERFVRSLLRDTAQLVSAAGSHVKMPTQEMRKSHLQLGGRLLCSINDPPDELDVDFNSLCRDLASGLDGQGGLRLNLDAICYGLKGLTAEGLESALDRIAVRSFWDTLGAIPSIKGVFDDQRCRDVANDLKQFLKDFNRRRNQIAHGSDGDAVVSDHDLAQAFRVFRELSSALPDVIRKQLKL